MTNADCMQVQLAGVTQCFRTVLPEFPFLPSLKDRQWTMALVKYGACLSISPPVAGKGSHRGLPFSYQGGSSRRCVRIPGSVQVKLEKTDPAMTTCWMCSVGSVPSGNTGNTQRQELATAAG